MLVPFLNKEKKDIINDYGTMLMEEKDKGTITYDFVKSEILECGKLSILDLIHDDRRTGFAYVYNELFKLCFIESEENVFDKIQSEKEFEFYRKLIRDMNCVVYKQESSNPEIQKFDNYKKMLDKKKGGSGVSFEAIVTSVKLCGMDTNEMTIYELNALFTRIGQFENNHTTTLFKTVSPEMEIVPWYSDVEEEKETMLDEAGRKQIEDFRRTGIVKENYKSIATE